MNSTTSVVPIIAATAFLFSAFAYRVDAGPFPEVKPVPPSERLVGMAYSTWFPPLQWNNTWGTPILGEYRSDNPAIIRRHAEWLCDAGVDFIWIDWSNNVDHDPTMKDAEPVLRNGKPWLSYRWDIAHVEAATEKVFEVFSQLNQHPKISIFLGLNKKQAVADGRLQRKADQIYEQFVSHPFYGRMMQRHLGKPLLAVYVGTPCPFPHGLPEWDDRRFTVRWFTGFITEQGSLREGRFSKYGYWSWEDRGPATYSVHEGRVEAMVVTAASRKQGTPDQPERWVPARGRRDGATFREAWAEACKLGPKLAMVVAWNEFSLGESESAEVSKDIEPSVEHGDKYLKILKEEIARFKGNSLGQEGFSGDVLYDPSEDSFYRKRPIYVTWIMIWNGSTEKHWWKPSEYHGCKVEVNGSWQSIDWNSREHIETYCRAMHEAGIDVIVADLTNGFRWKWQAKAVQQFCLEHGMKFAIAFNPHSGARMEDGCREVWDAYASKDAPFSESYLYKEDKPLIVLYTTRSGYAKSIVSEGTYRANFSTVWASGEDSDRDKWGWQLEPNVGPVPSAEAMFVTPSLKFRKQKDKERIWRKNLSWLDYGFSVAAKSRPKYLVVGSFDDLHERNAWMVVDTEGAPPGMQMRDRGGVINPEAYYRRVAEWLKGTPTSVEGGVIPDGAYLVKSADDRVLGAAETPYPDTPVVLKPYGEGIEHLIWFYHLGGNVYRLVKLNAGLPLGSTESNVLLEADSQTETQRWFLEKKGGGYCLHNKASGEVLTCSESHVLTGARDVDCAAQNWSLIAKAVVSASRK